MRLLPRSYDIFSEFAVSRLWGFSWTANDDLVGLQSVKGVLVLCNIGELES